MFDVAERDAVRAALLERARTDERIVGAAVTGSTARGTQDRWSDVDLFFAVDGAVPVPDVLEDWSSFVMGDLGALHSFDLRADPALYRAFLLPSLLEVDLGFTPAGDFGARGDGGFSVVFGDPIPARPAAPLDVGHVIGLAWHHVLHARVCLERGNWWAAEYWMSAVRDHVLTLACARHGLPTAHAKGAERLPATDTDRLRSALVGSLERQELHRALAAVTEALLDEIHANSPPTAAALRRPLLDLLVP